MSSKYLKLQLRLIYHGFLSILLSPCLHVHLMPIFSCIANTIPLLLFNPWSVSLSPCPLTTHTFFPALRERLLDMRRGRVGGEGRPRNATRFSRFGWFLVF
ncbi:hypothetical protein J3E68DRAFT_417057 [Trichoderma sp. SZMC 28012]